MLRWLSISLIAFIVMSAVFSVQFGGETSFGLRVVLGGMLSFWPTLLIMFLLSRLEGVVPDWHKKAVSHPVIALLAMNGFRLPFRVKHIERGVPKAEEYDA